MTEFAAGLQVQSFFGSFGQRGGEMNPEARSWREFGEVLAWYGFFSGKIHIYIYTHIHSHICMGHIYIYKCT